MLIFSVASGNRNRRVWRKINKKSSLGGPQIFLTEMEREKERERETERERERKREREREREETVIFKSSQGKTSSDVLTG